MPPKPEIRNFSIIAHIDHGKSTLADRLLQATNAVSAREARDQILDSMDIERERGITIKASAVTVMHHHTPGAKSDDYETDHPEWNKDLLRDEAEAEPAAADSKTAAGDPAASLSPAPRGRDAEALRGREGASSSPPVPSAQSPVPSLYMLNFIDTPGHVDFNYEVSRALKACEGAILVVDATQGVQAQTLVNAYLAINENLTIIPVINKIDLPSARPVEVAEEIEQTLGFKAEDCLLVSAKTGQGIKELLANICEKLPPPRPPITTQLRALIFDAVYDDYRGVIVYFRVFDGSMKVGDKIRMMGIGRSFQISDIGKMNPKPFRVPSVGPGETGYLVAAIRTLKDVRIGDTITLENDPAAEPLEGYQPPRQMVFCDFYPATSEDGKSSDFEMLRDAVEKLSLNDSSFTFQPVHSEALGFGYRCGFLGLLHMDIIQERLEREGGVEVVQTAPTVSYHILVRGQSTITGKTGQALRPVDLRNLGTTASGSNIAQSSTAFPGGAKSSTPSTPSTPPSSSLSPAPRGRDAEVEDPPGRAQRGREGSDSSEKTSQPSAAATAILQSTGQSDPKLRKKFNIPEASQLLEVNNPADLPDMGHIDEIREPICRVDILTPKEYIGDILKLCLDRRGTYKAQTFVSASREMIQFEIPLAEIIYDFFDKMKGLTSGYGTMDYEVIAYRPDRLVKLDILINGEPVEALAIIVHRDRAEYRGRTLVSRLREQIPRHQFEIPIQAAIGGKVIARETIKAFRKNVIAKCYGGDVSRKRKLLEKQKEGKKRMKAVGSVTIPQEAFMAVLDQGD